MKKIVFVALFFCCLGLGFYVGSGEDTYAHKLFSGAAGRFPANDSARRLQDIWSNGKFENLETDGEVYKSYSSNRGESTVGLCQTYPEIQNLKMTFVADGSVSGEAFTMSVSVACDVGGAGGPAPLFVKSFCAQPLSFYKAEQSFLNSTFRFNNILDGFPKLWFADSIEPIDQNGNSLVGVRPSQEDVTVDGRFTINCLDF